MRSLLFLLLIVTSASAQVWDGNWHGAFVLNDSIELPVTFTASGKQVTFHNGEEDIVCDEFSFNGDSVIIKLPVYLSEIHAKLSGNGMDGYFINPSRTSHQVIPFYAEHGLAYRFSDKPERTSANITGRYHVVFDGENEDSKNAVGVFQQDGNHLTGTFLTTSGDHRFMEGEVSGNTMWLSAFDGSHLFLHMATIKGDSLVDGHYFSGSHWHDTWSAVRDSGANLLDSDSLSTLNEDEPIEFTLSDENGNLFSLTDDRFIDKAVIIQLMGSWCPNCLDESVFLSEWYSQKPEGIELIALDFERVEDTALAMRSIARLKSRLGIIYPVIYAGSTDRKKALKQFPFLSRLFAFPTTIFLDKNKQPVSVHAGFTGPANKEEYEKFRSWFESLTSRLAE